MKENPLDDKARKINGHGNTESEEGTLTLDLNKETLKIPKWLFVEKNPPLWN